MSELTELVDALSLSEDSELKKVFTNGNLRFPYIGRICVPLVQGQEIQQV
jgi:hypothetical protein